VSLFTVLYTSLAGLPASIWTDRLQGVIMVIFIVVGMSACFSDVEIGSGKWESVSTWTDKGFESLVTLVLAILGAELFNMGNWQRVYAASNDAALRKGCVLGAVLIFPTMLLFGISGMLAEAQDLGRPVSTLQLKFLAFFDLLAGQPEGIAALVFALAVSMVASSVDSLQTALISVLSKDILQTKLSSVQSLLLGQFFLVTVNVPAIAVAVEGTKDPEVGTGVINLFLIADLLALSIAMPVFMGLWPTATQAGALAGCFSGLLLIMAFGWFEFGTFVAGLEMITLMAFGNVQPTEVGLNASRTCIIFFVLPIVTVAVTYVVSWMERVSQTFPMKVTEEVATSPGDVTL
jgi:Na+/proline symporter